MLDRSGSSALAAWLPDRGRRRRVLAGGHRNLRVPGHGLRAMAIKGKHDDGPHNTDANSACSARAERNMAPDLRRADPDDRQLPTLGHANVSMLHRYMIMRRSDARSFLAMRLTGAFDKLLIQAARCPVRATAGWNC